MLLVASPPPLARPLAAQPPQLVAIPVEQAPVLNGLGTEDVWSKAPVLTVNTQSVGKWGLSPATGPTSRTAFETAR